MKRVKKCKDHIEMDHFVRDNQKKTSNRFKWEWSTSKVFVNIRKEQLIFFDNMGFKPLEY